MTELPSAIDVPQRQFLFISDGKLQEAPTVRHLLRLLAPAHTTDNCHTLLNRFLEDANIYALPVINDEEKPVALIDRKRFIEFFSKRYSREIFGNRTILELGLVR